MRRAVSRSFSLSLLSLHLDQMAGFVRLGQLDVGEDVGEDCALPTFLHMLAYSKITK